MSFSRFRLCWTLARRMRPNNKEGERTMICGRCDNEMEDGWVDRDGNDIYRCPFCGWEEPEEPAE